jgi:predicted metalloprotease with PDZ domain
MRWLAIWFATLLFWAAPARAEVSYQIDLSQRASHVAIIEMTVRGSRAPLDLWMPAWTPGAYELRHWGRNLTPLAAENEKGQPVSFSRVGPDRFHVDWSGTVKLRYRVYASELSDDASQIDSAHAYLNGSSIFLAARGQEKSLHQVAIALPSGWKVATALEESPTGWETTSYEALIDAPIEIGKFARAEVRAAGRLYHIVIDGASDVPPIFQHDLARIAEAEAKLVGTPPYRQYLLLIHLADGIGRIAALEHAASSSVIIPHRGLSGGDAYDELLYVAAHELFHAWNARRLRPAELVPYDLEHEQRSRSLWITEGLTEYYAHRALRLAGLWAKSRYLERLGDQITRAMAAAARGLTVEEEAELTWQAPDEAASDPDAYYARGHLVALALDAEIRAASGGRFSLDDVFKSLLSAADRAGGSMPIDGARLAEEIAKFAPSVAPHVAAWTRAPHETDRLDAALSAVGLKITRQESSARTFAGFAAENDAGALRVVAVGPGGPAQEAGLRAGDRIVRLDGSPPTADWAEKLAAKLPGAQIAIEAVRATRRMLIELRLETTRNLTGKLEETPATPKAIALRQQLLGG